MIAWEDIHFEYVSGQGLLKGLTLTGEVGQILALLGPNGAGKTTLLRLALGELAPHSGRVQVGGDAPAGLGRRELARRVAVVSQQPLVPFGFTVMEAVGLGRAPHLGPFAFAGPAEEARIAQALERVDLGGLAQREMTTLSGGERKRAVLARALVQDAPAFFLDEPAAGLDVGHRVRTFQLLRELAGEGRTIIIITHELELAAQFADRLALLHEGRLVAVGPPDRVLQGELLSKVFQLPIRVSRTEENCPTLRSGRHTGTR